MASSKMRPTAVQVVEAGDDNFPVVKKYTPIAASSSGDNEIIAAVVGKKIRVLHYTVVVAAAVTVRFESSAGGTALTGQMEFAANSGNSAPEAHSGHFETVVGESLSMELSGAVSVAGHITYVEVD